MPYVAKPKPCYMDQFEFYKVIDGRKVYRGNGRLYSWDILGKNSIQEQEEMQDKQILLESLMHIHFCQ